MTRAPEGELYKVLMMLREGGHIVPMSDCPEDEVHLARARGWLFVDRDGFGLVYRPVAPRPRSA